MFNLNMFNYRRNPSMRRSLVDPSVGTVAFSWPKALWLYGMGAPALVWGVPALDARAAAVACLLGFATVCGGHSVGLHRGVIHGAFEMPRALRGVLLLLFCQTGLGGPLSWIRLHHVRDHWQNTPAAPPYFAYGHGLARDFVWNLHLGFAPARPGDWVERYGVPRAVESDGFLRCLERTWRWQVLLAFAAAAAVGGIGFASAVVCGRVAATTLFHWFVGYMSHAHGRVRFEIPGACEVGRDSWLLGVLSFGEGFHNTHHALPRSARMGIGPLDLDVGYGLVRVLERAGLVRDVVRPVDPRAWRVPPRPRAERTTVVTRWRVRAAPEAVWPLLCDSRTESGGSWAFRWGLPRPLRCELPEGRGGVGRARRCVSDRGVVEQTILAWDPPTRLAFRMDRTSLPLRGWIGGLEDEFVLRRAPAGGTWITRTTRATLKGRCPGLRRLLLRVGLAEVHRHVFRNWARAASRPGGAARAAGRARGAEPPGRLRTCPSRPVPPTSTRRGSGVRSPTTPSPARARSAPSGPR
jgi:stearoyl-CoA desaturase (delta-9 desaturase)